MPLPEGSVIGTPRCSNCGHELTGAVRSSTCPECGRPLVEVLVRDGAIRTRARRYTSRATVLGIPAIAIAFGPDASGRMGRAKGWIAIGDAAFGVVAIGGRATGVVAFGGLASGIFAFGGMAIGVLSGMGGCAIALLGVAAGGMTIGLLAVGGFTIGFAGIGGFVIGRYAWCAGPNAAYATHVLLSGRPAQSDPDAVNFFSALSGFLGNTASPIAPWLPIAWVLCVVLTIAAFLCVPALLRWSGERRDIAST